MRTDCKFSIKSIFAFLFLAAVACGPVRNYTLAQYRVETAATAGYVDKVGWIDLLWCRDMSHCRFQRHTSKRLELHDSYSPRQTAWLLTIPEVAEVHITWNLSLDQWTVLANRTTKNLILNTCNGRSLRCLARISTVETLSIRDGQLLTDDDFAMFAEMESLRELRISRARLAGPGLSFLRDLPNLDTIKIHTTHLMEFDCLGDFSTRLPRVCDYHHVSGARGRYLAHSVTNISDEGLRSLRESEEFEIAAGVARSFSGW